MFEAIKSVPLAFFSRDFYNTLVNKGRGVGFGFIAVMLALGLLRMLIWDVANWNATSQYTNDFFQQLPAMTMKEHVLSMDHASPYIVQAGPEKNAFRILFDMDHELGSAEDIKKDMATQKVGVIVTAKEFAVLKDRANSVQVTAFDSSTPDFSYTHDQWTALGAKVAMWILPSGFLFMLIFFLIGIFFKIFIGGLLAMIFGGLFKLKLDLGAGMRLMAAASLPAALLSAAAPAIPGFITIPLWLGYGLFGLWAAKPAEAAQA